MFFVALALAVAPPVLKPGAVVALGLGPYPLIKIIGQRFDPPVTIDAGKTMVQGLQIWDSAGIIWRGGVVSAPQGSTGSGPGSYGADIRRTQNISFIGTKITDAKNGIVVGDSQNLIIRNVNFTGLRSDGIDVAGTSDVLIENSRFDDFSPVKPTGDKKDGTWKDGDHPDAIQLWTTPNTRRMTNITIRGNTVDGDTQGINFFGPRGDGFSGVIIENNDIRIGYPAAISVFACDDCTVRNNHVSALPGSKYKANLRFEQSNGVVCGNILASIPRHPATRRC